MGGPINLEMEGVPVVIRIFEGVILVLQPIKENEDESPFTWRLMQSFGTVHTNGDRIRILQTARQVKMAKLILNAAQLVGNLHTTRLFGTDAMVGSSKCKIEFSNIAASRVEFLSARDKLFRWLIT